MSQQTNPKAKRVKVISVEPGTMAKDNQKVLILNLDMRIETDNVARVETVSLAIAEQDARYLERAIPIALIQLPFAPSVN